MQREFAQRPPRIPVPTELPSKVTIRRIDQPKSDAIGAELIDISRGGTKLYIATPLHFEESVEMHIEIPCIDMDAHVLATVRHIREAQDGRWIIGCSVAPPLDEKAICRLMTNAAVDRRLWPREPISLRATVRQQLGRVDADAALKNLSQGGFCVLLAGDCEVGERIQVTLAEPVADGPMIEARVHWQAHSPEGFLTGCAFLRPGDYDLVRAAVAGVNANGLPSPAARPARRKSLDVVGGITVSCATCVIGLLYMEVMAGHSINHHSAVEQVVDVKTAADTMSQDKVVGETKRVADKKPAQLVAAAPPASPPPPAAKVDAVAVDPVEEPSASEPALREWVDDTGTYRVMAALLAVHDDHVVMRREDGKEINVPLVRLSALDVEFAKNHKAALGVPSRAE